MIFITGDIHGYIDISKLFPENFTIGPKLTRDDFLIICGDFGLLWNDSEEEQYWLGWLDSCPWTTLWIDGNHENFSMLSKFPVGDWNGGKVQFITDNIIHLMRGSVFTIDGLDFFVFGGAESHDKELRTLGESLWDEELPSAEEIDTGRKNLQNINWNVDYVITHSLPTYAQDDLFGEGSFPVNPLTDFLEEVADNIECRVWFTGHYHVTMEYDDAYYLIYNDIVMLTPEGFETVVHMPYEPYDYDDEQQ